VARISRSHTVLPRTTRSEEAGVQFPVSESSFVFVQKVNLLRARGGKSCLVPTTSIFVLFLHPHDSDPVSLSTRLARMDTVVLANGFKTEITKGTGSKSSNAFPTQ
jgi:hypothetical protein